MIKIALFRGSVSWISKAIEWDTRSKYCHAAVLLPDGSMIESMEGVGVHSLPSIPEGASYDLFIVSGLTEAGSSSAIVFLEDQLGKPYANLDVLGFITRSGQQEDRGAWFCSELVFAAIEAGGVTVLRDIPPFMVTPGMLAISPLLIPQ